MLDYQPDDEILNSISKEELDRIEMLGDNCELGNTLVKRGYNGGSLFRFVYNPPESFLHALENDFNGMFSLENLTPLPWGMVSDSTYNMHFHTQILKQTEDGPFILDKDDEETRKIYLDELKKYKYLKKKFMERAQSGRAIYIIKCNAGIKPEILDRIENELKRIAKGAPFILLEVRQSSDSIPSDRIERLSAHRAVGWIREFADYSAATVIPDMEGWIAVITEALKMPMTLTYWTQMKKVFQGWKNVVINKKYTY